MRTEVLHDPDKSGFLRVLPRWSVRPMDEGTIHLLHVFGDRYRAFFFTRRRTLGIPGFIPLLGRGTLGSHPMLRPPTLIDGFRVYGYRR